MALCCLILPNVSKYSRVRASIAEYTLKLLAHASECCVMSPNLAQYRFWVPNVPSCRNSAAHWTLATDSYAPPHSAGAPKARWRFGPQALYIYIYVYITDCTEGSPKPCRAAQQVCIYTYISLCTSICICMCTYTPTHIYIHVYTTLHACDHFLSRRSRCTKTGTKSERKARKTIPELRKELTESHFLQRSRYSGNPENAPLSVDTSVSLPNFTKRRGVTRRPP